jgi:hypothetical protein
MRRVLIWILEFVVTLAVIMGALFAYDVHKHGMGYVGSSLFDYDLNYDGRIALTCAVIIFLVDVCYVATRKTMRMGPGPNRNDDIF